jgi:hypothetical protein
LIEKEFFAVVFAFEMFRSYITDSKLEFTLIVYA